MAQVFKTKRGRAWHIPEATREKVIDGEWRVVCAQGLCEAGEVDASRGVTVIDGPPTCKHCIREQAERDRLRREAEARELDVSGVGTGKVA